MSLLRRVEGYLRRHGVGASTFGRLAVKDAHLVAELRRGRELRASTKERVAAFLDSAPAKPKAKKKGGRKCPRR
jgi:hypothetical protein